MINKETIDFVAAHRHEDPRTLALQAKRYPAVEMQKAVTQIEGWQTAERKLPTWAATEGIIFPPRISMEQCSSEETANYKSNLVTGENIADLTGGFGIDCSFMARGFKSAFYIERNPLLCDIARHNFKLLGLGKIEIINCVITHCQIEDRVKRNRFDNTSCDVKNQKFNFQSSTDKTNLRHNRPPLFQLIF